ncbi:MAG: hypothetical protein ACTSQY_11695, partial [Candidatus Odinarchaeia archaeon]
MSVSLIVNSIMIGVEFLLSGILLYKWNRADVKYYSDLPFLFGITIFLVGVSGLIKLVYVIFPFTTELMLYQIRGVMICITGTTMMAAVLKIWLFERPKAIVIGSSLYAITFLAILFLSTTPQQIVTLTSPLVATNIILIIITFGIAYAKKRLPMINSPLLILGSLLILVGQVVRLMIPSI